MKYSDTELKSYRRRLRMNKRPGIYIIRNIINGKAYIGSSVNVKNRLRIHKNDLKANRHNNTYLQRAWNKYSPESFKFIVILYCSRENLLLYEQYYIDAFFTYVEEYGYNLCPIAGSTMGYKYTDEQRQNLSKSLKGKPAWNKGKTGIVSDEARAIMSAAKKGHTPWNKGIPRTDEEKKKMSNTKKGSVPWNKGKKMPESVRKKISEKAKNRKHSDTAKQKMSKSRRGKSLSKAHCLAISKGLTGRTTPSDVREKISKSLKERNNELRK